MSAERTTSWLSLGLLILAGVATVAAADTLFRQVAPPVHLREIDDSIAEYQASDPTVLVLGSSHARTFLVTAKVLAERTGGAARMLAIPLEFGKFSSYAWTLRHRLAPLIEQRDASGGLVRPGLSRFVLVTEWWDSSSPGGPALNLPARAWDWPDFFADLARNGLTPYNENFLTNRWNRALEESTLVQDRGHGRIANGLKSLLRGGAQGADGSYAWKIADWQQRVEGGVDVLGDPSEMAAFEDIVRYFQGLGIETTVLLYPRMPGTLTERAKQTTLRRFSDLMAAKSRELGFRLVDLTLTHPLTDADFEFDFDHVTHEGNVRFSTWALDGALRFLEASAPARAAR
jgi:hypothetical protein